MANGNQPHGAEAAGARAEFRLGDVELDPSPQLGARIWSKDSTVWVPGEDDSAQRLGWLELPQSMESSVPELQGFAEGVKRDQTSEIVLLGMGGSSLAPEMFARIFGSAPGYPSLRVIDTTHPREIEAVTSSLDLDRTMFVVSSKSGGTLETMSLYRYFRGLVPEGDRFVAITDADTSLDRLARNEGFRSVWRSAQDVGGRYSALSHFGLVPAALIGVDVASLLASARDMSAACGREVEATENPGIVLGQAMGMLALRERHALTFFASDAIATFAAWIEQLIAESTGKGGRGVAPIVGEPEVEASRYGNERSFVNLCLGADDSRNELVDELVGRGHPVITLRLGDKNGLGAEIFRWEFATAVAGAVLGVNPFDQPDVEAAKRAGREVLESGGSIEWGNEDPEKLFAGTRPGELAALLAFAPRSAKAEETLAAGRRRLILEHGLATTAGFGPRYLHSTGQLHKGGPPGLTALVVLDEVSPGPEVPGSEYDFGRLVAAQASGDARALRNAGRAVGLTTWERFERWAWSG